MQRSNSVQRMKVPPGLAQALAQKRQVSTKGLYRRQMIGLLKKNWAYQKRQKRTNCCQLLFPLFFLALLTLVQTLISFLNRNVVIEANLEPEFGVPLTAALVPLGRYAVLEDGAGGSTDIKPILTSRLAPFGSVVPYTDQEEMEQVLFEEWNDYDEFFDPLIWRGTFNVEQLDLPLGQIEIYVGHNDTFLGLDSLAPKQSLLWSALIHDQTTFDDDELVFQTRGFPSEEQDLEIDVMPFIEAPFYNWIVHLQLPVILGFIVYDKEFKLLGMMSMVGLKASLYWISQWMFSTLLYSVATLFMIAYGTYVGGISFKGAFLSFQWTFFGFRFFTINDFGAYFIPMFVFGQSLIALSFLLSTMFQKTKPAGVLGYIVAFSLVIIANTVEQNLSSQGPNADPIALATWSWVPSFAIVRMFFVLSNAAALNGAGIRVSELDDIGFTDLMIKMVVFTLICHVLTAYLFNILESPGHPAKSPLFFLEGIFKKSATAELTSARLRELTMAYEDEEADVQKERDQALNDTSPEIVLRAINLSKTFYSDGSPFQAVKSMSFTVRERECFGLLGANGAGKTTTISMLSGLYSPTSGLAAIGGWDSVLEMDQIHALIGVCPQHDLLLGDLTPYEHMVFYGHVKNLTAAESAKTAKRLLQEVDLWTVRNDKVRTFSGGMKRRLSVAISFIGEPVLIFLDEPTTGLDPSLRQSVWKIINRAKAHHGVILTTHSMEEADALCDRICIMKDGVMATIGEGAELKARHGSGYTFQATAANSSLLPKVNDWVQANLKGATVTSAIANSAHYSVPKGGVSLPEIFRSVEAARDGLGIQDWGISQVTLEDVFLRIVGLSGPGGGADAPSSRRPASTPSGKVDSAWQV